MRILVTGGAGYIGSHVVKELSKRNYEILVVDSMEKGNKKNLFLEHEFIQGEIQNDEVLKKVFSKPIDAVFHFAAWKAAGESMTHPEKYAMNNINGTLKLLVAMLENNCKYFIFSSSAAVYGTPKYLPLDENHPLEPENYYGSTKLQIEQNLKWFDKLRGLKFAALRYFNAAGYDPEGKVRGVEKTPANLLPIIMETAIGVREKFEIFGVDYDTPDGTCIRDYIHVSDLANAHILSLDYLREQQKSLVVNLGSEKGYSVKEIVQISERVIGRSIPHTIGSRRAGDPPKMYSSAKLAKEILGWKPKFSDPTILVSTMWAVYKDLKGEL